MTLCLRLLYSAGVRSEANQIYHTVENQGYDDRHPEVYKQLPLR